MFSCQSILTDMLQINSFLLTNLIHYHISKSICVKIFQCSVTNKHITYKYFVIFLVFEGLPLQYSSSTKWLTRSASCYSLRKNSKKVEKTKNIGEKPRFCSGITKRLIWPLKNGAEFFLLTNQDLPCYLHGHQRVWQTIGDLTNTILYQRLILEVISFWCGAVLVCKPVWTYYSNTRY